MLCDSNKYFTACACYNENIVTHSRQNKLRLIFVKTDYLSIYPQKVSFIKRHEKIR